MNRKHNICALEEAVTLADNSIRWMTMRLVQQARTFAAVAHADDTGTSDEIIRDHIEILWKTLAKMQDTMELLGNYLSNTDGCDKDDSAATDFAFEKVREVLEGKVTT